MQVMDDSVKQALAKWPNVPHCYGWLTLDARGAFRMRDDAAQAAQSPGDIIRHSALLGFIYRNYACDERGAWYFQNGPQRVYVELQAAPFIARTDPAQEFVAHDGSALGDVTHAYLTNDGRLLLQTSDRLAMLDDRDLAQCLLQLRIDGQPVDDSRLLSWLDTPSARLQLHLHNTTLELAWVDAETLEQRFGFVARPGRLAT